MVSIGTVVGYSIEENKDDDTKSVLLQVKFSDDDDIKTVELLGTNGEQIIPCNDLDVAVLDIGSSYKVAIAFFNFFEPDIDAGEKEIFSYNTSQKLAKIKLDKDGNVLINGGGRKVARKDDETNINIVTDKTFLTWVGKVTAAINILAPGTILPNEKPGIIKGKIVQGSASVEVCND
jgi:hypothetical protein